MLGKSLAPLPVNYDYAPPFCYAFPYIETTAQSILHLNANFLPFPTPAAWTSNNKKKWITRSSAQIEALTMSDEDWSTWESSRQALAAFGFSVEEKDKILGKAFGQIHSPYWGEERKREVPKFETVNGILDYLRSLSLSDDDLVKLLKKFPEVLGCCLEGDIKNNVELLEKEWGIKGKSLRNLLIRNPKVLGYNVDCKGDCMAKCTRCWVRF